MSQEFLIQMSNKVCVFLDIFSVAIDPLEQLGTPASLGPEIGSNVYK